ncbi:MAG: hypothetical protein ABSD48_10295 [Armatimonadota bacterium]|jgi:hypothetical protein
MKRRNMKTKKRPGEAILAGLPADAIDSCVDDMAEAVVAILLTEAPTRADESDDASGDLREI